MDLENKSTDNRHIVTLTVNELQLAISNIVKVEIERQLETKFIQNNSDPPINLLTRMEVAEIFKISTVSLDKWKRAGILPKSIKMAGRVYYLKNEILEIINKRKTK